MGVSRSVTSGSAPPRTPPTAGVHDVTRRLDELRHEISQAGASSPRVWSLDGATFQFEVVASDPPLVGSYVRVETRDGTVHVGQVTATTPITRAGPQVSLDLTELGVGLPGSATATVGLPVRAVAGSGPLLGTVAGDGSLGEVHRGAFDDARIERADPSLTRQLVDVEGADLELGALIAEVDVAVSLHARGFGRHTFVCGQSGSGKTYALGKLLEQLLLRTTLPLVILDPNSDYVTLTAPRDRAETGLDSGAYREQAARIAELRGQVPVFGSGGRERLKVRFGRLRAEQQALVLGLDPLADTVLVEALRRAVERAGVDCTMQELLQVLADGDEPERALAARAKGLGVDGWSTWAEPGETALRERLARGWRAAVFDLGGVESVRERAVVAGAVLQELWHHRYAREPRLIVIDEAHNVCPADARTDAQAAAAEVVVDIAAEGRKFGLYLLLSTQEPHKVHPDVLSQCANLILMRTTSRVALDRLATTFSDVPAGLLDLAPSFGIGQGVVAGRIVPHPLTFRTRPRLTEDGGRDVPADWTQGGRPS